MKKIFTLSGVLFLFCSAFTQQLYHFSLYNENRFTINPAMSGITDKSEIAASFRKQWTKIDRSPMTSFLTFNSGMDKKNIGFGASIFDDETGPTAITGFQLNFSYHLVFDKKYYAFKSLKQPKMLSFGVNVGGNYYRLNTRNAKVNDENDPSLSNAYGAKFFPDMSFGVYYQQANWYLGASIPQLLNLDVNFQLNDNISSIKKLQHYYLMGGAKFNLKDDEFYVEPSLWLKYVIGGFPQGDLHLRFAWLDHGWIGLNYRSINILNVNAGVEIKKRVKIGYAYDFMISKYMLSTGQIHEVFVSYNFAPKYQK